MSSERMSREEVAALLKVAPQTIESYVSRRGFPRPDVHDGRTPYWSAAQQAAIVEWMAARPGRGAGGGRPASRTPPRIVKFRVAQADLDAAREALGLGDAAESAVVRAAVVAVGARRRQPHRNHPPA